MKNFLFTLVIAFYLCTAASSIAVPFTFTDIPSVDNPGLDLSGNFSGDISVSGGQVMFTLFNNGPAVSTIAAVYFEYNPDSLLMNGSFSAPDSSLGVTFDSLNNLNLPQGNNISFDADFAQSADNPAPFSGINLNEFGSFLFDGNFDAVILALNSGSLRVGMHVINIDERSDSYVSSPVPEPASMLLLGIGLLGLSGLTRKKVKQTH